MTFIRDENTDRKFKKLIVSFSTGPYANPVAWKETGRMAIYVNLAWKLCKHTRLLNVFYDHLVEDMLPHPMVGRLTTDSAAKLSLFTDDPYYIWELK